MRPTILLAAALLLTPALARADTFYTYSGTVLLNGSSYDGTDFYSATVTNYVNVPLAATVVIGDRPVDILGFPQDELYVYSNFIQFPPGLFYQDPFNYEYLNFENCSLFPGSCTEIFLSTYQDDLDGGPAPSLFLLGEQNNTDQTDTSFVSAYARYEGQLDLATTPEPSTFVLLASGLTAMLATTRRHFCKT